MPEKFRDPNGKKPTPISRWGRVGKSVDHENLTWRACDARALQAAIVAATEDGAAVLLSKTSDGGALAVQILSGTERFKFYAADTVTLDDLLREMAASANP